MSVSKEIIYESADVEDTTDLQLPEEVENEDIERIHLDLKNALKHFAGSYITSEGVDFTGDGGRKLKGYNTGAYILEYVGKDYPEPETPQQKFNRLQMEILDLKDQVEKTDVEEKPDTSITKEHITELSKQLEQIILNRSNNVEDESKPKTENGTKSVSERKSTGLKSNIDAMVISDFEARLNRLEKAIGSAEIITGSPIAVSGSVAAAIDDLKTRVDCLNPSLLEAAENRLNAVLAKQNEEKKDMDVQFADRVDEIYKVVANFQNSHELVNNVITRLKTLASLHEQAADFSSKLNELHNAKKEISEGIDGNKQMIQEFGEHFKEAIQKLKQDIEGSRK